jgi:hypothetical protein
VFDIHSILGFSSAAVCRQFSHHRKTGSSPGMGTHISNISGVMTSGGLEVSVLTFYSDSAVSDPNCCY